MRRNYRKKFTDWYRKLKHYTVAYKQDQPKRTSAHPASFLSMRAHLVIPYSLALQSLCADSTGFFSETFRVRRGKEYPLRDRGLGPIF